MCKKNFLKSTKITMDDVYRKVLQVMKHRYIILNPREKFYQTMWLTKKATRPVIANKRQNTKKVLYKYAIFFKS